MKSINIKGKNYVMVNERIKFFREKYENWSLTSDIVNLTEESCIIKATITDENGVVKATGFAQEDRSSSMINKTSFIENCETSAWGRALGNLGIGIDDSIASAEEVNMAIKKQELQNDENVIKCEDCGTIIENRVAEYSYNFYKKHLCRTCQKKQPIPEKVV